MKIKVADYIINYLADQGIKEAFVVYGAANGDLIDAFTRTDKIKYICSMHEQGAGFAAEAYARATKNFGVCIVTSGPGGMNLVTSAGNCFYESIPCLYITGQPNSKFLRKTADIRQNAFQESDIVSIMKPVTKYAVMVTDPYSIKYHLDTAMSKMKFGRPGPVLLDIPLDIQKTEIETDDFVGKLKATEEQMDVVYADGKEFIDEFVEDFNKSLRPVVMVGGGVRLADAVSLMRELGEILKVPIYPTWNALDVITSDYPYYAGRIGTYGGEGRNFGIQNSDLLLCIGTRVSGRITGGIPETFARDAKKYVVDIDKGILTEGNHDVKFDRVLLDNAKYFIKDLISKLKDKEITHKTWLEKALEWRDKYDTVLPEHYFEEKIIHPYAFARSLSHVAGKNDIIITDCGGNVVTMNQAFQTKFGQLYFSNNGNSPMGFSFAASIGAWFGAEKDRNVICVIGDGGMNMNIQELQTLKNYGVGVKVFIMNNHIYGITKAFQKTNFNGRMEACGPVGYKPPNFLRIASAYGIDVVSIDRKDTNDANVDSYLYNKISNVLNNYDTSTPVICDVNCHEHNTYKPRIFGWNTPIEDMYPYLPREEFKENMIIEPVDDWESPSMPDVVQP